MAHQITRGYGVQEVPADFAAAMNRLKKAKSPLLNVVLVTARRLGWRTESLAAALEIPVSAASKRMERATPTPWPVRMRDIAGLTLRDFREQRERLLTEHASTLDKFGSLELEGITEDLEYLVQVRVGTELAEGETVSREDVVSVSARARATLSDLADALIRDGAPGSRKAAKQLTTLARRLARAEGYEPPKPLAVVDAAEADERWMSHLSAALMGAKTSLGRLPAFKTDHPGLREQVTSGIEALRARVDTRTITVEQATTASARLREKIQAMKAFEIDPDADNGRWGRAQIVRQLTTVWNRLRLAEEFTGGPVKVGDVEIPVPVRVQTMLHGEALDEETIAMLQQLQSVASLVNGGTAPDSAHWRASRKLSEELWRLNNPTDPGATRYTAYYLARVMGVTHHAVITRLRRYQRQMQLERSSAARRQGRRGASAA